MRMRLRQAIGKALEHEMEHDDSVIILGEDVAAAGGAFKVTEGLLDRFGSQRVIDTPISETAILGAGLGAATAGLRPVVEMMFVEFTGVALDQLVMQAANFRYLSQGQYRAPLTMRAAVGAGLGFGAQHSQILEHWFTGTPGLKVYMASDPQTAYDLTRAAVRDPDPVVLLEHKALYGMSGDVAFREPAGQPLSRLVRQGDDLTIVSAGLALGTTMAAVSDLPWAPDVIDLHCLSPWDREAVRASVSRTGVLVTVEEAPECAGWGAHVVADVVGECWSSLDRPPLRITAPSVPIPHARGLEDAYLPSATYIRSQIDALFKGSGPVRPWWEQ